MSRVPTKVRTKWTEFARSWFNCLKNYADRSDTGGCAKTIETYDRLEGLPSIGVCKRLLEVWRKIQIKLRNDTTGFGTGIRIMVGIEWIEALRERDIERRLADPELPDHRKPTPGKRNFLRLSR